MIRPLARPWAPTAWSRVAPQKGRSGPRWKTPGRSHQAKQQKDAKSRSLSRPAVVRRIRAARWPDSLPFSRTRLTFWRGAGSLCPVCPCGAIAAILIRFFSGDLRRQLTCGQTYHGTHVIPARQARRGQARGSRLSGNAQSSQSARPSQPVSQPWPGRVCA